VKSGILLIACLLCWLTGGCSVLPAPDPVASDQYLLEYPAMPVTSTAADAPLLLVTEPRAYGGIDTVQMAYLQQTYGIRYFTHSRWVDTPARMLAPHVAEALQGTGRLQAVYRTPGSIAADLRLDMDLIRFYQDFTRHPSEFQVTLRAWLIDLQHHRPLATREFDITVAADTEDAYGGVVAANVAVPRLLEALTGFCLANLPQR
jgi:cholesterol transport system auxiliary component